jgi:hypothetical protein
MKLTALLFIPIAVMLADMRDTPALQSGDTAVQSSKPDVAAQEIHRLIVERSKALVRKDIAALDRILAPEFIYTNASGAVLDKDTYLSRYVRDPDVKWFSQNLDDIKVSVFGNSAVVTCRVEDCAEFNGQLLDAAFRSTYLYVQDTAGWRCVAGHTGPAGE